MIKGKKERIKMRHRRVKRKLLSGKKDVPRLLVRKSLRHIYAVLIDDRKGQVITSIVANSKNVPAAKDAGRLLAEKALEAGYKEVVFDRGGYLYHGRVKALAEAARAAGLKF
ncbi:MAG: 50S ribosomal protein L18 [Candidatus Omnitrophota bacterium]